MSDRVKKEGKTKHKREMEKEETQQKRREKMIGSPGIAKSLHLD